MSLSSSQLTAGVERQMTQMDLDVSTSTTASQSQNQNQGQHRPSLNDFNGTEFWCTVRLKGGKASRICDQLNTTCDSVAVVSASHPDVIKRLKIVDLEVKYELQTARLLEAKAEELADTDPKLAKEKRTAWTETMDTVQEMLRPARTYQTGRGVFMVVKGE